MRVVLRVPGMNAVAVRRDIVYRTASDQPLHMDVYSPPGPPNPRPAVILVHGGPVPRTGAKNMGVFVSYGELLAASGFVAVAFDHRFLAPSRLPDARDDLAALVARVRADAPSLGVEPDRLAIWAFSGGGLLLAAPLRDRPAWLRAVLRRPRFGRCAERAAHPRRPGRPRQSLAERRVPSVRRGGARSRGDARPPEPPRRAPRLRRPGRRRPHPADAEAHARVPPGPPGP